jgi:4'-phosphopantetheinyl transferase
VNRKNNSSHLIATPEDFIPRRAPLRELDPPQDGEVHLWYLNLGELGGALKAALDGKSGSNEPVRFTAGQLRFARRFYLRLLLGAYLGIAGKSVRIIRSVRGKPVLDPVIHRNSLHFSMAKSVDRLLVGFSSTSPVGVDLEPAGRRAHRALGVARRYFSPAEADALEALSPADVDRAFLHTWACKEAVVKASGRGIANELCRFTVETRPDLPPAVLDFENENASNWSLALTCPEKGFLGAVATHDLGMSLRSARLLPALQADF